MTATLYKFTAGTESKASEVNTNSSKFMTLTALNTLRQLVDRAGVWSAGNIEGWGDAYIDADGRENSVTTYDGTNTTAYFNTNKYSNLTTEIDSYSNLGATTVASITCSGTVIKSGYFTTIHLHVQVAGNITVVIKKNTVQVASVGPTAKGTGSQTMTLAFSDYSSIFADGDAFDIIITNDAGAGSLNKENANKSFTGTFWSYSNQVVPYGSSIAIYTAYNSSALGVQIKQTIPVGTFNTTISKAIGVPLISNWETGADIQYKITSAASDDSGWLSCGNTPSLSSFTAFSNGTTATLYVKLIPKSSSPTSGYPSLRGFYVYAE